MGEYVAWTFSFSVSNYSIALSTYCSTDFEQLQESIRNLSFKKSHFYLLTVSSAEEWFNEKRAGYSKDLSIPLTLFVAVVDEDVQGVAVVFAFDFVEDAVAAAVVGVETDDDNANFTAAAEGDKGLLLPLAVAAAVVVVEDG